MVLRNLVIPLIITMIVIAAYVTIFTIVLKNSSEKKKLLPIRIIFYILIVLEIIKICFLIGRDGGFHPNRYPIVFCSMTMFAYPIFCFKKNKFSDVAMGFSVIPGFLAFIMFTAIQWKYNMSIMQVHSFIYHGAMLTGALYLLTSKLYKFEFKKFFGQFLAVGGYMMLASIVSLLIGGAISVFAPTDPYLKFIYNKSGFLVGMCIILIAIFVAYFVVYGLIDVCSRKCRKKARQNNTASESEVMEAKNV